MMALAKSIKKLPTINIHLNRVKTPANVSIMIVVCGYLAITMAVEPFSKKSKIVPSIGTRFINPQLLSCRFAFLNSQLMDVAKNPR